MKSLILILTITFSLKAISHDETYLLIPIDQISDTEVENSCKPRSFCSGNVVYVCDTSCKCRPASFNYCPTKK